MRKHLLLLSLTLMVMGLVLSAQQGFDFSTPAVIERLRQDIEVLASDDMEGRESGTEGELKAASYIRERMIEVGLKPVFEGSYYQEFLFPGSFEWGDDNFLRVGEREFEHGVDFFTMPGSANAAIEAGLIDVGQGLEGIPGFDDYSGKTGLDGKIFLMEYYIPVASRTEADLSERELTEKKLELAMHYGASAILFKNALREQEDPRMNLRVSLNTLGIPVMFLKDGVVSYLEGHNDEDIILSASVDRPEHPSLNVAGYIDNGANTTVVIGGHFDHLGYGGRSSRSPGDVAIHYGADDNASGTAGVLEAARYLSQAGHTGNNYLFIAFGAEEKGLVGSRHFTTSGAYDMDRVNYMLNLDMIGRMTDNRLSLIGTGSSPIWDAMIERLAPEHFQISKSPGGLGGSDHAPFYMINIPVIFFFTGVHDDYHRPTDTPDKINYEGAYQILAFMFDMIGELDEMEKVPFSRAPVAESQRRRSDSPALGLMPDHAFDGEGLRVQAVIDNRPAQRAGMKDGDVIIRIGEMDVREIQTYMEALGKLQPGSMINVVVKRGEEEVSIPVQL